MARASREVVLMIGAERYCEFGVRVGSGSLIA